MPILILEGADPLSDAALKSESESIVRNAQSDAGRVLKLELMRYCRGEVHGRSFLVAGHRGAGKTMMVADALDKVLRQSRRPGEQLLRPLPIFLHGPSLFEAEAVEPARTDDVRRRARRQGASGDGPALEAQARVALKQIILGLHRAVAKEFARAYRQRLVEGPMILPSPLPREDLAELAAQFEIELTEDPSAARLHEFWDMAGARQLGVLFDFSPRLDQGARELVAVNGMCNAHQRISGEISAQDKSARSEEAASETQSGLDLRGGELVKPLVSVLAGAAVAGGAAAGSHSLGMAMLGGLVAAIGSAAFFKASTSTTRRAGRQVDTTFIPDLSLKTLDRILPTLIQRLRDAGLAPVLIVDELDKVPDLAERFIPMMDFMKKLVAENVFSCFVTDRSYLETLRMRAQGTAYGRASSYFTHSLLVTYRPADVDAYLDKLLEVDRTSTIAMPGSASAAPDMSFPSSPPDVEVDVVDLEVLKWVLRHRSRLHALGLAREIAALRGEAGTLYIAPGAVRTEYTYRIDVTFQVAIEFQLAQPHVQAWLRQRPGMSQTLLDALYYPTREWLKGGDKIAPHAVRARFHETLVSRMNLAEVTAAGAAVSVAGALSDDDKSFLLTMMEDVLSFLCNVPDVLTATMRWNKLPPRAWSPRAEPGLPVLQSMLLGPGALVSRTTTAAGAVYRWRYYPTGEERAPREEPRADAASEPFGRSLPKTAAMPGVEPLPEAPRAVLDPDITARMERILAIEGNLWRVFKWAEDPAAPDGRVFKMLGDRLRVMPTTPAWSRVQAAIVNVNQVLTGSGSRSTLMEDGRALTDFLAMLDGSARALIHTLVVASFCGGARVATPPADALLFGLDALSTGLGFAALDAEGLVWAMERMETSARDYGGVELTDIAERAAAFRLDDPRLLNEAQKAAALGAAALAALDWVAVAQNAWGSLTKRLPRFVATDESPAASLHEVLCAIRVTGPAAHVGLDLKAMTLQRWTTAFLAASSLSVSDPANGPPPPKWLIGHALNRLGAAAIDGSRLADLVGWALGPGVAPGEASAIHDTIFVRKRGGEQVEFSNRLAVCVTSGPDAPMGGWTTRPRRGMVLVLQPELLPPVLATLGSTLKLPLLVATAQGPGVRISADQVNLLMASRGADRLVWVYRQRFAQMLEPCVIGPQTPDEVLDYVQASGGTPA
jgi:hypothetical protein